jgi:hypothetical protein
MLHQLERQGGLPTTVSADGLADYLRDREAAIICHAAQLAIDEHTVDAVRRPCLPPHMLAFPRNAGNSKPLPHPSRKE